MDLNKLIRAAAKGEQDALKEIYEAYRVPFYFIALSVTQDASAALTVAAEAFRRIRDSAYRFEEELDAEYWMTDVLYTLSCNYNHSLSGDKAPKRGAGLLPETLKQNPEIFVKAFTSLGNNEIAALCGKKKSELSRLLEEKKATVKAVRETAAQYCPDYWERIASDAPTGAEAIPHNVRTKTAEQERKQKRIGHYKVLLAVVLLIGFLAGAAAGIIQLIRNNYGSDIDKNELGEDISLQFNNNIAMTELNGVIYFRGINNAFYMRNMETGASAKLSDDYPKELLNDGTYIYYRNNIDGYMYRIDPDGGNRTRLCDVPGSAMALYEGYLYFSTTGGIYRIPSGGGTLETAELILDTSNDANLFCVDMTLDASGNVYFASGVGKGIHHITDYKGEPSVDGIFTEEAYTLQIDGSQLYFDYKEASGEIILYSFDLEAYLSGTGEGRVLPKVVSNADGINITLSTGAFYVKDGCIYYAGVSEGKSALIMLDEARQESVLLTVPSGSLSAGKLSVTDIYISDEWAYCFASDGKANGKRIFFAGALNKDESVTIYES